MRARPGSRQKEKWMQPRTCARPAPSAASRQMPPKPLTARETEAAREWLAVVGERTFRAGRKLFEAGVVTKPTRMERGHGLRATVGNRGEYAVKLRFDGERWVGMCSCARAFDCEHCCAAMLRTLAEPELADKAAEPFEPGDARERFITPHSFTAELIARLGRNLTAAEQCAAREVDRVFRDYREAEAVPLASLEIISAGGTRKI